VEERIRWAEHPRNSGTRVLLIHGLGSSAEDWVLQMPALCSRHPVSAVDLPGHGGVSLLPGWPTVAEYAQVVASAMETHAAAPAHVVGLSLGGAVALQLALDFPAHVRSLSLINTFGRFRLTAGAWLRGAVRLALVVGGRMDWLGAWVAAGLFPRLDQALLRDAAAARIAGNPRRGYLQSLWATARFNVGPRLRAISLPTLVVAGTRDTTVPTEAARGLAAAIPGARFCLLEGAGHVASVDAAEDLNAVLLSFLKDVDGQAVGS